MLQRFRKFIGDNMLLNKGDRVLLAVSGGIDSMVMTHLFLQLSNELGIAHCNFALRGEESDNDEALVRDFARVHNIAFYSVRFDTKAYATEKKLSIQMAARELRYTWFEKIRNENGFDLIAVAHNLNDNIETLLINLLRGTGIAGLTGMRLSVNKIIRPLLFAKRDEITAYSINNNIAYREDQSNSDTKYLRNRIRHLILPQMKEINPSVEFTLNETTERMAGINEIVTEYIETLRQSVSTEKNDSVIFKLSLLKPIIHNKSILFELFRPYGINDVPVNDLINVIEGKTGGQLFTGTHQIFKNRDEILIFERQTNDNEHIVINNINDFHLIKGISSCKSVSISEDFTIPEVKGSACIDVDKLIYPLIVRKWNDGDNFFPLGMEQKKKLSDYFIDNKYSIHDKANVRILESDGKIVWIIGDRLDNRFRITKTTVNALIIITGKESTPEV
jgi:tRNA(Ile)-lysidine synthase